MPDCGRAFVRLGDRATRRLRRALTAGVLLGLCALAALDQPATPDTVAAATPRWTEAGDAHISLFDGERFETLYRFRSREALLGAPRFSPEGRFAYFASPDDWISRYDLWNLRLVA